MKKVGVLLVALVAIVGVYYMTVGSSQIKEEMRDVVDREITTLKEVGFIVKDREVKDEKEHFTITFDKSDKIVEYLKQENFTVTQNDLVAFEGGKFAVDIEYLPTFTNAISMEIYPTKLPTEIYVNLQDDEKSTLKSIEKMIEDKVFLVHININKLLNSFDGSLKDIDQEFTDNSRHISHFISKGFKFEGKLKDKKIDNLSHNLDLISYSMKGILDINISDIKSNILNLGSNSIDMDYSIKSIQFGDSNKSNIFIADKLFGTSKEIREKNLLNSRMDFNISSINFIKEKKEVIFKNIQVNTAINNLNENAIAKLQNFSTEELDDNETMKQLIPILKEITTANSSINISNISVESITSSGKSFDGFKLDALGEVNNKFDWNQVENNPLALLNLFDTKMNLEASNEIVSMIASDPRAMMLMMFIQPIDKNGKKVFNIEFSGGSLKVNGRPLM